MTRNVIKMEFAQSIRGSALDRIVCLEETVSVAARVAARLIHAKLAVSKLSSSRSFHKLTRSGCTHFLLFRKAFHLRGVAKGGCHPGTEILTPIPSHYNQQRSGRSQGEHIVWSRRMSHAYL